MHESPNPNSILTSLSGQSLPLKSWVTSFHLLLVVLDPFTHESSWIVKTAGRVLNNFAGADCRVGWVVAGTEDQTKSFLGPWCDDLLTFTDPNAIFIQDLGFTEAPGIVHINQAPELISFAQGWNPSEWREVVSGVADQMHWSKPAIPEVGDPTPYAGSPLTNNDGSEIIAGSFSGCGKCSACRAGRFEKCQQQ